MILVKNKELQVGQIEFYYYWMTSNKYGNKNFISPDII